MPRDPSPAQRSASQQNGKRSQGRPSAEARLESSLDAEMDDLRAGTVALAHDPMLAAERCKLWHDRYRPQTLILEHLTTECARSSLLADQVAEFRQAELEAQAQHEERQWRRRQRRRARYLGLKIKTRPAEAVEQLLGFGEGVELLVDAFLLLVNEVRTVGYLTPPMAVRALAVCGCTQEPASIGCNPLAYTLVINNLGCSPAIPAADIDPWLEPVRRPATLRDRPRHELLGADPDECRTQVLTALEAECDRLLALAVQIRKDVDIPSLCQALNRVCLLTDKSARRAARAHTEARVTFRQASNDLVKALDRDRKNGVGPVSSVPGPLPGEGDGPADAEQGLASVPDAGPLSTDRREHGFFPSKPENEIDGLIQNTYYTTIYVEARVPGSGCARLRKTGAQTDPPPAQTGAETPAAAVTDQAPGSDDQASDKGPMTNLSTTRAPHSTTHDPMLALIAKYQNEFDAELRPYDHLA